MKTFVLLFAVFLTVCACETKSSDTKPDDAATAAEGNDGSKDAPKDSSDAGATNGSDAGATNGVTNGSDVGATNGADAKTGG